jgi:D-alanyl-D-alanine dipeptidase
MNENKAKKSKSVVVVRPEVAARLKKYCTENGLKIQFAAEQAVAEWLQKQMKQK